MFFLSFFLPFSLFSLLIPFFYTYIHVHTRIYKDISGDGYEIYKKDRKDRRKKRDFRPGPRYLDPEAIRIVTCFFFSFVNSTPPPPSYPHDTRYDTPDYLLPQLLIRLRFERPILSSGFWNQVHFINLSSYLSDCIL